MYKHSKLRRRDTPSKYSTEMQEGPYCGLENVAGELGRYGAA